MTQNWYAVYTKPQQEQKVSSALIKKGIEAYCPLTRLSSYKGFGKRINWQPLLSSIVFVNITETQFAAIRQTGDVINFMYWLSSPVLIPGDEIKSIQQFAGTYQKLKVEKTAIVKNAIASVINEPFQYSFEGVAGTKKIRSKLLLPSLGYILIAEMERPAIILQYNFGIKEMITNLQLN